MCSHFIQASAVPTIERLGLLEPIDRSGRRALADSRLDPWGWIVPPPEKAGLAVNLRREVLDPMVREAAAATPGVDAPSRPHRDRLLRDGGAFAGVTVRDRDGEETTARAARRRRRRPRLAGRQAGRGRAKRRTRTAASPTAPTSRARRPRAPRTARSGSPTRTGRPPSRPTATSPSTRRCRPRTGCPSSSATRPRRWSPSWRAARAAADPRGAAGRRRARQDRHDQPGARSRRPGAGPGRRRGARHRPAVRRRLRLGLPVGRMAGRLGRPGAARRGVAGEGPEALPPHRTNASSAATPS